MKTINTTKKVSLATLLIFVFSLSTVIAQNDTMYVMKNGVATYAISIKSTDVDSVIFFKPTTDSSTTVTDYDGNVYNTVTIGSQVWMKENLKTTHYADGTPILHVTGNSNWDALIATDKAYCYYDDDSVANADTYGALYTWAAAMNGVASTTNNPSGIQGVCPTGWHLPSDAEWTELTDYLGGTSDAGGKLKETGPTHWYRPNTGATNETGFTALPGGSHNDDGTFYDIGKFAYWWSATEYGTDNAYYRNVYYTVSNVGRNNFSKEVGFSVRCVRDN